MKRRSRINDAKEMRGEEEKIKKKDRQDRAERGGVDTRVH